MIGRPPGYDETEKNRPNYGAAWATPRYQTFGPEEDPALDRVLLAVGPGGIAAQVYAPFSISVPDAKCRVRVDFAIDGQVSGDYLQTPNTLVLGSAGLRLWAALQARPRAESPSPADVPVQNLVGTGSAPLAIPTDARLWGYGFEIETASRSIGGWVRTVTGTGAPAVAFKLHLLVRYNSLERMSAEEWKQLVGRCGIRRGERVAVPGLVIP